MPTSRHGHAMGVRSTGAFISSRTDRSPGDPLMSLRFTKMHGLGNDFMVIDAIHQQVNLTKAQIATLGRRDIGVGFDQCLLVESSDTPSIDFFYRIFNADGQEVGQCGNGARCLARFLYHHGLTKKSLLTVSTPTTKMQLQLNNDDTVTVSFAPPKLTPKDIPLLFPESRPTYTLSLDSGPCTFHAIQVGNPHAVILVSDLSTVEVAGIGKELSENPAFPQQTNVGFIQILNPQEIQLRVYERGCGETRACGSGAVAAAAIGRLYHHLNEHVSVHLPGGTLTVDWRDPSGPLLLTGPATFIYEGTLFD